MKVANDISRCLELSSTFAGPLDNNIIDKVMYDILMQWRINFIGHLPVEASNPIQKKYVQKR